MNGRKIVIDQSLCRKVELMVKGGAKHSEVAGICGISTATVSRIRSAGYNAEQFMLNNDKRREDDQKKRMEKLDQAIDEVRSDKNATKDSLLMSDALVMAPQQVKDQLAGQMEMDLSKPAEEQKSDQVDVEKLKRFYAAQIQKIVDAIMALASALQAGDQ